MPKGQNIPHRSHPEQAAEHPETNAKKRQESQSEKTGATPEMHRHAEQPLGTPSSDRQEMERAFMKQGPRASSDQSDSSDRIKMLDKTKS